MNAPGQFLLYTAPDGAVKVDVFIQQETVWLTQKALAQLFGVKVPAINKHLKNIFDSGELVEASVVSILETTAADGKSYSTRYYNLDAIIAVGYRVNSYQATRFTLQPHRNESWIGGRVSQPHHLVTAVLAASPAQKNAVAQPALPSEGQQRKSATSLGFMNQSLLVGGPVALRWLSLR